MRQVAKSPTTSRRRCQFCLIPSYQSGTIVLSRNQVKYRFYFGTVPKHSSLNLSQFVECQRWCPRARESLEEARVFAGDELCHRAEIRRISARFYALQTVIN